MEHQIGSVTIQVISKTTPSPAHPNDVRFMVKYPSDYKGKKFMPEGETTVSRESAEAFTRAGIGHIAEETPEAGPIVSTETKDDPKTNKKPKVKK